MRKKPNFVIPSGARNLAFSATCNDKISRLRLEMTLRHSLTRGREERGFRATEANSVRSNVSNHQKFAAAAKIFKIRYGATVPGFCGIFPSSSSSMSP